MLPNLITSGVGWMDSALALRPVSTSVASASLGELAIRLRDDTPDSWLQYLNALTGLLSVFVAAVAALIGLGLYNRRKDRLQSIERQLNSFHRPLLQCLQTSSELHAALLTGRDPTTFRVIRALLENATQFSPTEHMIIREIVAVGENIETIVDQASGFLEDETLREPLGELVRHVRMFRWVAREGSNGDHRIIEKFVYPRAVNDNIQAEYLRLTGRMEKLRAQLW